MPYHLPILTLLTLPLLSFAIRRYNIVNNCPLPINLYINGENQGSLAAYGAGQTTRDFSDGWSGFIYSDFNQGNPDGAGTVRAGFYGTNNYYYIVTDQNWLNVGVGIQPIDRAPKGGFCLGVTCEVDNCPSSFTSPPTRFPPPQSGVPPAQPLYECPQASTGYTVTFCPAGTIPNYQTRPRSISPVRSTSKCLDVRGGVLANGTPVQIYDCNGTGAQKWVIKRGGQQIRLSGTSFCLDAGSNPASGVAMKIWTCYDNLAAQQWTYTPDNLIILTNKGWCTSFQSLMGYSVPMFGLDLSIPLSYPVLDINGGPTFSGLSTTLVRCAGFMLMAMECNFC
ncbi:carbohydrate-binding module family 13 protein [Hebeloma cylindrosporum]|uniref:Carbohydrate-binding module family 13 protein n=1 Tax=Hebeloma cylindrosporum TaxID=76867 RepID=A0A0C3BVS6_HEBCY|nr:carbohydrate-binding module family 13 protein [Hebeloma cylindrosporum h7]